MNMYVFDQVFLWVHSMNEITSSSTDCKSGCMLWLGIHACSLCTISYGVRCMHACTHSHTHIHTHARMHTHTHTQMIKDWVLFSIIGVIIIVDILFLIIVTSIPSTRLQLENQELPSNVSVYRVTVVECVESVWL